VFVNRGGNFAVSLTVFALMFAYGSIGFAQDNDQNSENYALKSLTTKARTKFFGDGRLRYENAHQEAFSEPANGLTVGLRAGLEFSLLPKVSALVEGEGVFAIVDNFDDASGNNLSRPVIADPDNIELNRAQIQIELAEQSFLTIGRQNLGIDDQRFIGRAPFRQNQQSFDAVHFSTRTDYGATFQGGYFNTVKRALGSNNPNGEFRGDSYFFNSNLGTSLGRFGLFHYALDLETGLEISPNNHFSSRTTGIRYDGRWHADIVGLDVEASYARQSEFADNPVDFNADYWLFGARGFLGPARIGFRAESLGSNNGEAFQTPIGSRHLFQGEADIFLVTPKTGLIDLETSAIWVLGNIGPFSNISASARYHWFKSATDDQELGAELDLKIVAAHRNTKFSLVYADYDAKSFGTDTQRVYLTLSKRF